MSNNKVSIVLPVYNGEQFLSEAIDSILAQSYKDWELIIVDDCSTDSTPSIIEDYSKKDDRIRYYRNDRNRKLPGSLNKGFSMAQGEYLTWTSDDNLYRENALERMVTYLDSNEKADFVYADYSQVDCQGKEVVTICLPDAAMLPVQNIVGACFLYRKSLKEMVGDYDENLFLIEDYDYWIRCYLSGKLAHINEDLYLYRIHEKSLSAQRKSEIIRKQKELRSRYYELLRDGIKDKKILAVFLYSSRKLGVQQAPAFWKAQAECSAFFSCWAEREIIWPIKAFVKRYLGIKKTSSVKY